jgi:hypothetical protein
MGSLRLAAIAALGIVFCSNVACSPPPPPVKRDTVTAPQAAHVSIQFYSGDKATESCAGTLLGPTSVLTAAHCASNKTSAVVFAPNAGGKKAKAHVARWFDWNDNAVFGNASRLHDVAILELDSPIRLAKYPEIADTPARAGVDASFVKRVRATGSQKIAFEATKSTAASCTKGLPTAYRLESSKSSLDPGGPVYDSKTGKIIGVVAGRGTQTRTLYAGKTDALKAWIRSLIAKPPPPGTPPKPPTPPKPGSTMGTPKKPSAGPKPTQKMPETEEPKTEDQNELDDDFDDDLDEDLDGEFDDDLDADFDDDLDGDFDDEWGDEWGDDDFDGDWGDDEFDNSYDDYDFGDDYGDYGDYE